MFICQYVRHRLSLCSVSAQLVASIFFLLCCSDCIYVGLLRHSTTIRQLHIHEWASHYFISHSSFWFFASWKIAYSSHVHGEVVGIRVRWVRFFSVTLNIQTTNLRVEYGGDKKFFSPPHPWLVAQSLFLRYLSTFLIFQSRISYDFDRFLSVFCVNANVNRIQ